MRRILFIGVALFATATPGFAQYENYQLATDLGTVLAAEEMCGLEYSQDAIAAFIEANVPADDMSFAGNLADIVMVEGLTNGEMSKSAQTAHCAQIKRVAIHNKFIAE